MAAPFWSGGNPPISAFLSHGFNIGVQQPAGRDPGGDGGTDRSAKWTAEEVSLPSSLLVAFAFALSSLPPLFPLARSSLSVSLCLSLSLSVSLSLSPLSLLSPPIALAPSLLSPGISLLRPAPFLLQLSRCLLACSLFSRSRSHSRCGAEYECRCRHSVVPL